MAEQHNVQPAGAPQYDATAYNNYYAQWGNQWGYWPQAQAQQTQQDASQPPPPSYPPPPSSSDLTNTTTTNTTTTATTAQSTTDPQYQSYFYNYYGAQPAAAYNYAGYGAAQNYWGMGAANTTAPADGSAAGTANQNVYAMYNTQPTAGYTYQTAAAAPATSAVPSYASIVAGTANTTANVNSWHTPEKPQYTSVNFKLAAAAKPPPPKPLILSRKKAANLKPPAQQPPASAYKPAPSASSSSSSSSSSSTATTMGKSTQWPPKLRAYVERAFDRCVEDSDRQAMEGQLREIISKVLQSGEGDGLWAVDWDNHPLPSLPGEKKAQQKQQKQKKAKRKAEFTLEESSSELAQRRNRQQRFGQASHSSSSKFSSTPAYIPAVESELDWDKLTIKGYSQDIEKPFLRLTSAPDPASVRPESVLKRTIKMLREKWKEKPDYDYTSEQLKSARQDLTVQRIKNTFTVEVYQMHARLALENDDMGEFNKCQTQLKELYREGLGQHQQVVEFTAYRLLYFVFQNTITDLTRALCDLDVAMRAEGPVVHALKVITTLSINDYHGFFKLYRETPNMGDYLMDKLAGRMRLAALKIMAKGYKFDVPVDFVQRELAFDTLSECLEYLHSLGTVFKSKDKKEIDCKTSLPKYMTTS